MFFYGLTSGFQVCVLKLEDYISTRRQTVLHLYWLSAKGKTYLRARGCRLEEYWKYASIRGIFLRADFFWQAQDRGVSNSVVGIVFGSYSFTAFLFAPISGWLVSQSESCEELRARQTMTCHQIIVCLQKTKAVCSATTFTFPVKCAKFLLLSWPINLLPSQINRYRYRAIFSWVSKTETKVIILANHNRNKKQNEPIRNRGKYKLLALNAGKRVQASHDWLRFYIWLG